MQSAPMAAPQSVPLVALVYRDGAAASNVLEALARQLPQEGFRVAGLLQHDEQRPNRSRCAMILEDIPSGEKIPISEDRGPHARGCMLSVENLLRAAQLVRRAMDERPDLVILAKYGKTECEGGGFRDLIAQAVDQGLPLLIGVPSRNLEPWREFVGAFAAEIDLDQPESAMASIRAALKTPAPLPV